MKSIFTQFFTLVFLISSFCGISQTSLEGIVTDAKTGEPIIFGTVALYKNEVIVSETETNLTGKYFFSNIESGIYDIKSSYIGYTPKVKNGIIIKPQITNRLNFSLKIETSIDAVEIKEYKTPLSDYSNGKAMSNRMVENDNSFTRMHSIASVPTIYKSNRPNITYLPKSGQITAGEWNDLHNWKDWMSLLENEEYSIMTNRFEIYPTRRYSVLVINEDKAIIPNIKVKLVNDNGIVIWETITDNAGKAELWDQPYASNEEEKSYHILVNDIKISDPITIDQGSNTVEISHDCYEPTKMNIVFTVDATSSMNDEIEFLKSELLDVIDRISEANSDISYKTGSVFYRDTRDDYITRVSPLSDNKDNIINFVKEQNASGGGDKPEAVEIALAETLNLDWDDDALKLVFLILDAPPHEDEATMIKIRSQIKDAASKGIKLIPITASGIGRETEFLMKFMAIMTNGTYVFITDDSGIGESHLDPVVTDYKVEKLNDCIVRLITQYSKSYSCDIETSPDEDIIVNVYPNPSTQFINVITETLPTKIDILSSNGMIIKTIYPTENTTRIELDDLVNGVYTVVITLGENIISKRIILLK